MRGVRAARWAWLGVSLLSFAATARAQVRPFVFTVTTAPTQGNEGWTVQYEAGYAERTAAPFGAEGLEHRVAVQGDLGAGFTVLGRLGIADATDQATTGATQEGEILKDLLGAHRGLRLATGVGARHEWDGTTALLGRVSMGHTFPASSLFGNLRLEKPFTAGRDSLDLITTAGWLHKIGPAIHLGLEAIGEDLEGLWDPDEAEGGAKLFVGPSLHLAPAGRPFYASLCGGPILYATHSPFWSGAPRPLAASGNGYTVRISLGYAF